MRVDISGPRCSALSLAARAKVVEEKDVVSVMVGAKVLGERRREKE